MKSQEQILTKLEILADMKHKLAMKDNKTDFERLCVIQYESNMNELAWVLDINIDPFASDEDKEESEFERDQMLRDDATEEREVYDDDDWNTLSI